MRPLSWYVARLRRMSPAEVGYRLGQAARKKGRKAGWRHAPAAALAREALKTWPRPERERMIRFFEVRLPWPGAEAIDWSRDYKSGVTAPRTFYGDLDYRDAAVVGDIKYTWELNRHQFLVAWAQEYVATGDEDAAAAVTRVVLEWVAENPRWTGINWTSSLELALRILSWGIAFDLCGKSPHVERARPVVEKSVAEQADFIRGTLSLFSSANNHLMGELVGLLAAGAFFPGADRARERAEFARKRLLMEAQRQNFSDGVNREAAVYYHHYTLEYQLTAVEIFRRMGWEVPGDFRELCRRMVDFVDAMTDDRGEPFEIGDRDDGTVTGLNLHSGVGVFESLLWSGFVLFGPQNFGEHAARIARSRGGTPAVDPRTRYWHGAGGTVSGENPGAEAAEKFWFFPEGGYAVVKRPDVHAVFRAGPFGYPSIAAHSHCDQLTLCLRYRGQELLTDSGTYSYHTEEKWRRYFKGTAAHNTVRVDGLDQAEYAGPFLWGTHADGEIEKPTDSGSLVVGRHQGYERLPHPVKHVRKVEMEPGREGVLLTVHDDLSSAGSHLYELIWNFGPGVMLSAEGVRGDEGGLADRQWLRAAWRISGLRDQEEDLGFAVASSVPFSVALHVGDEAVPAGFYSRQFGERIPIVQLRVSVTAAAGCQLETLLGTPDAVGLVWS